MPQCKRSGMKLGSGNPVERRIAAAKNYQPTSMQFGRVADLVMNLPTLKGADPVQSEVSRLE